MRGGISFFCRIFSVSRFRKLSLGTLRCFRKFLAAKTFNGCEVDITFLQQIFLFHITKKIHCDFFIVSEELSFIKNFPWVGWGNQLSVEQFFCLTLSKKINGNSSLFQKNSGGEKFYGRENGISLLLSIPFVSHHRKLSLGTLRGFRKILVWKKYMDKTGGIANFRQVCFCPIFPKKIIEKSSVFQKHSVSEKIPWMREGVSRFSIANFSVSQFRKISLGTLRGFRKFLAAKSSIGCEGTHHVLPSNFSCLTLPKNFIGISSVFQKTSGSKNFLCMTEGDITFFRRKVFESQYRKVSLGTLPGFRKKLLISDETYGQDGGFSKIPSYLF